MTVPADYSEESGSFSLLIQPPPPPPVRQRVDVEENDGIMLSGLNKPLMSHIKTLASNRVYNFHNDEKNKFRILVAMNNVLDLDEIASIFSYTYSCPNIHQEANLVSLLKGAQRNWTHVIKQLYSKISQSSDLELITTYKIVLHLAEIHDEHDNIFEHESSLSEYDFIVKVWGAIVEKLFYKTKVFCRWGDTVSEKGNNDFTNHKIDLRMLCKSNLSKYDLCEGGFGKVNLGRELS